MPSKGARVEKGLGKRLQGTLRLIAVIQKRDRFSLIASFLEKEKESTKMEIPPSSHTFSSAGFINPGAIWSKAEEILTEVDEAFESLSIDMVEVGD